MISHLTLKRAIGILGVSLPFLLAVGNLIIFRGDLERSISNYYHTGMGDVFVATLIAIGLLLFAYRGYDTTDNLVANLAGLFAIGVALFPTLPANYSEVDQVIGIVHIVSLVLFLLILAYFPLVLFTKTHPATADAPGSKKIQRDLVYRVCGVAILLSIMLSALFSVLATELAYSLNYAFWLESIAIVAFGISWLVKGEALLRD